MLRSARDSGEAMLNRAGLYAGDGASQVANQVNQAFERHPLAIGAMGLMAGRRWRCCCRQLGPKTRCSAIPATGSGARRRRRVSRRWRGARGWRTGERAGRDAAGMDKASQG